MRGPLAFLGAGRRTRCPGKALTVVRWLALPFALALAAAAVYLLAGPGPVSVRGEIAPPLDHIDDASRAKLERVIERGGGR